MGSFDWLVEVGCELRSVNSQGNALWLYRAERRSKKMPTSILHLAKGFVFSEAVTVGPVGCCSTPHTSPLLSIAPQGISRLSCVR